jgi:hypothetical protein
MSKVVADAALPDHDRRFPGLAKWTVTWNLPASTPQTALSSAVAQGTTGAVEWERRGRGEGDGGGGRSPTGSDVGAPSGGWVTVVAEVVANGAIDDCGGDVIGQ